VKKTRKHYTSEEKVAILRRHLLNQEPISKLCDELGVQPTVFYRWQEEFFENGAAAFQTNTRPNQQPDQQGRANPNDVTRIIRPSVRQPPGVMRLQIGASIRSHERCRFTATLARSCSAREDVLPNSLASLIIQVPSFLR